MLRAAKLKAQKGQALAEYVAVAVFLSIIVWYALVGGTTDGTGSGGLYETDVTKTTIGTYQEAVTPGYTPQPGLIQALHKKQEDFQDQIYQP